MHWIETVPKARWLTAFVLAAALLSLHSIQVATTFICAVVLSALHYRVDNIIEFSLGPIKVKLERTLSASERPLADLEKLAVIQIQDRYELGCSIR